MRRLDGASFPRAQDLSDCIRSTLWPPRLPIVASRALLNTAKVMADNPVMLRLKELEALDAIAGKVKNLTVLNGTEGLMNGLVRLGD